MDIIDWTCRKNKLYKKSKQIYKARYTSLYYFGQSRSLWFSIADITI